MGLRFGVFLFSCLAAAQVPVAVRSAGSVRLPLVIDSNTQPTVVGGALRIYSSDGSPLINTLSFGFEPLSQEPVIIHGRTDPFPLWIESTWTDGDGTVLGWYHQERLDVCAGSSLTVPEIGALVSHDGGRTFHDLGIVLTSGDAPNCSARNGYFAAGHGDFSVILDRQREFFYFLFGNYGGEAGSQGISIARLPFRSRFSPVGEVRKYFGGGWDEPGLGGRVTPVFPATVSWAEENTDSFWGPSVHWNHYLNAFVILMNRACCAPFWPQEGTYLSISRDLSSPSSWSTPQMVLPYGDWYPWAIDAKVEEHTGELGKHIRIFSRERSEWELEFDPQPEASEPPPSEEPPAAPPPGEPGPPEQEPVDPEFPPDEEPLPEANSSGIQ